MFANKSKFGGHSLNGFEMYLTFFLTRGVGSKAHVLRGCPCRGKLSFFHIMNDNHSMRQKIITYTWTKTFFFLF